MRLRNSPEPGVFSRREFESRIFRDSNHPKLEIRFVPVGHNFQRRQFETRITNLESSGQMNTVGRGLPSSGARVPPQDSGQPRCRCPAAFPPVWPASIRRLISGTAWSRRRRSSCSGRAASTGPAGPSRREVGRWWEEHGRSRFSTVQRDSGAAKLRRLAARSVV